MNAFTRDSTALASGALVDQTRFPLSSAQERCWFVDAMSPGNPALNVALRWEIEGRLSRDTIEEAFRIIVQRQEALRTRIVVVDGTACQEVLAPFRPRLDEIDLGDLPETDREDAIVRLGKAEAHKPFDLARDPYLRVTRLSLGPDRAFLLVTIHQIAFDGWSIRLLSREFGLIAAAVAEGRPHGLPGLTLHYGDYAAWQGAYLASGHFAAERDYWIGRLRDAPYFEVAPDRVRRPSRTHASEILAMVLPAAGSQAMIQAIKARGVTAFSFGAAVIAAVLKRYTGLDDVSVATQVAGRDDPELEPIIGVFINNLVLRFELAGCDGFAPILDVANRTVRDALVHASMPFHRLVELLKPPRDPGRMPLVSVNFTVLDDVMDDADYGGFRLRGHPSLSAGSLYDLNFFMVHWPSGWRMALEYNADLFERRTAEDLLDLWRETLARAVGAPDFTLASLPAPRPRMIGDPQAAADLVVSTLLAHPDVSGAMVLGSAPGGQPDVAVTLRPDHDGSLEAVAPALMAFLGQTVPRACLPGRIDIRMTLPRRPAEPVGQRQAETVQTAVYPTQSGQVAGRHVLETLTGIWQEVLGLQSLEPHANFFECGGHSLLALRMLSRVGDAFGRTVSVSELFQFPTLGQFASRLSPGEGAQRSAPPRPRAMPTADDPSPTRSADPAEPDEWRWIEVRPPGADPSIFGINSISELYGFAAELGGDRGLFSVQLFKAGRPNPFEGQSFEAIASRYADVIRCVQPHGPYVLFGLCVHGVLAYEVAQQLRASGEAVDLLAVKNAWHPAYARRLPWLNRWIVRLSQVRDNFQLVLAGRKSFVQFLGTYSIVHRSRVLHAAVAVGWLKSVPSRTGSEHNDAFLLSLMRARDAYEPRPYDGRVLQSVGIDAPRGRGFDPTLGWSDLITGTLDVIDEQTGANLVPARARAS